MTLTVLVSCHCSIDSEGIDRRTLQCIVGQRKISAIGINEMCWIKHPVWLDGSYTC